MYFDYPLEQGLRLYGPFAQATAYRLYFDYPLEQGLRHAYECNGTLNPWYFDYPLEQGLRRTRVN